MTTPVDSVPTPAGRGRAQQNAIYRPGALGIAPTVPTDVTELERRAKRAMSRKAWAYVAGAAGTGAGEDASGAPSDTPSAADDDADPDRP